MTKDVSARGARVELRRVSKNYGDTGRDGSLGGAAVEELSLLVEPGEICVLVGPSGCGKTTTMKMVNRLVEPSSGEVLIDGRDVATMDPVDLRRGVGYVIQQIGLFPHQTVAENVGTVPRLLGWPKTKIRARVDELLMLVGLQPAMGARYPAQLSGGERQRVGVARAMAAEPPVMLMDEPFGAVDPIVRERLQDEFLRLQAQLGTTVLFVTHDINEAIKMGTRVGIMRTGGHLVQYSRPAELLLHPVDQYVAEFVGADRALKSLSLVPLGEALFPEQAQPMDGVLRLPVAMSVRDGLSELLAAGADEAGVEDSSGQVVGTFSFESVRLVMQRVAQATDSQDPARRRE
jgi:osmoprotectant transport system ATP-binding protein